MSLLNGKSVPGLAITGMDILFCGCDGLEAFETILSENRQPLAPGVLPNEKLLLYRVTQRALKDAGFEMPGVQPPEGVILLNLADYAGQRVPLAAALDSAGAHLAQETTQAVVIAAARRSAQPALPPERWSMGFNQNMKTTQVPFSDGGAAVVLQNGKQAAAQGKRLYARIEAGAYEPSFTPTAQVAVAQRALQQAGLPPQSVAYLEATACGADALDAVEIEGLVKAYSSTDVLITALGSASANLGSTGQVAPLAALVKTALCLYHACLPGVPGWEAPKQPLLWNEGPFYIPQESRPWFLAPGQKHRHAALNLAEAGGCAHLILTAEAARREAASPALQSAGTFLFLLSASDLSGLQSGGDALRLALADSRDMPEAARSAYLTHRQQVNHLTDNGSPVYTLALLGSDAEELLREADLAARSLPETFEKTSEWQTPAGSTLTTTPLAKTGSLAFVYPGAFNSYIGMGRDLFRFFPILHESMGRVSADIGRVIRETQLYPRSLAALDEAQKAIIESQLNNDPVAMLTSGTTLSTLYTAVLRQVFNVQPAAAFGYSLGENSMMYALGVWTQGDAATNLLEKSTLFHSRLAGAQNAVRQHWGLPLLPDGKSNGDLWQNYVIMADPEKVRSALAGEPRVYLTHINAPRQVVIGGDPQGCLRVIQAARGMSLRAPFNYALHCAAMASERTDLVRQHYWDVQAQPGAALYSAAHYAPMTLEKDTIAETIGDMLCTCVDFPRLVRRVYDDGARLFIELGAGSNCARWVSESLKGRPHAAMSVNRQGVDDRTSLLRVLAKLASHGVAMNLGELYGVRD